MNDKSQVPVNADHDAAAGQWIDAMQDEQLPEWITLDLDSSVSATHGDQEGTAWNDHFGCKFYHSLFVFNQFSDLQRCALRKDNVHSADGCKEFLAAVIARHRYLAMMRFYRADAAFAITELHGNFGYGRLLL